MENSTAEAPVAQNKQFPCSQCGAKLDFAPGTTALQCPYCGGQTPIPQSEEQIVELDFREFLAKAAGEQESQEEKRVKCDKCGAETTMPPVVTASLCPFCGANLVLTAYASRLLKPKALLPFHITQKQAFEDFRRWINGLWFAPADLKQYAQSEGRLAGVYVPYWTYDSDTISYYRGARGDDYWATESYTATENGRSVTRTRQVRKTRWRPASGTVWNRFDDVLVMASQSLPRKYADRLEPWDLANLMPYADEFLSGFRAESYQVDLAQGFDQAREIMDEGIRASIRHDIGGDHQRIDAVKTGYDKITFKHILLPVWLSAYRYREKVYRTLINARTGEVQGERPFSAWKIACATIAALAVIALMVILASLNQ
jgi:DNA-directed RNA polymerase subunit RPC12/RpoP